MSLLVSDLHRELRFRITPAGLASGWDTAWDVRIRGSYDDFWRLASRNEDPDTLFFQRRLTIEGHRDRAHAQNLLDGLEYDWRAHVRAVLGRAARRRAEARMRVCSFNRTRDLILAPPIRLSYVASATRRAGHAVYRPATAPDPDAALDAALREFATAVGISVRTSTTWCQRLQMHLGELAGSSPQSASDRGRGPIVLGRPAISILAAVLGMSTPTTRCAASEITFRRARGARSQAQSGSIRACAHATRPRARQPAGAADVQSLRHAGLDRLEKYARHGTFAIRPSAAARCRATATIRISRANCGAATRSMWWTKSRLQRTPLRHLRVCGFDFQPAESHAGDLRGNHPPRVKVNLTAMGINPRATSAGFRAHETRRLQLDDDNARIPQRYQAHEPRQGL
jgi:hypothetical protein